MKKTTPLIALIALLISSCGGHTDTLKGLNEAEAPDSMMYYFGIMQANNFMQDGLSDTIMLTPEGREAFIRGFRDAMKMESDNDSYNKGLQLGLRLAIRLREFNQMYGMVFPEDVLADTFEQYVMSDSAIDIVSAQKNYYKIKDLLDLRKETLELAAAKKAVADEAAKQGYEMVSDTLFAKNVSPGEKGRKFKDGDRIAVKVNSATLDGRELGRQFPDSITIGAGKVPRIVCLATHTMTSGQTRMFMTTPQTLFGKEYAKYQLRPDEPVVFTVKAVRN